MMYSADNTKARQNCGSGERPRWTMRTHTGCWNIPDNKMDQKETRNWNWKVMEVLLKYSWLWPDCLILAFSPWINMDPLSGKTSTSPSWSTATSWSPRWRRRRTEVTALLHFRLSFKSSWKKSLISSESQVLLWNKWKPGTEMQTW